MSNKVGTKGQIVIEREIRERLGVEPGWKTLQRLVGDHVELYFVPPDHDESVAGFLSEYVKKSVSGDDWHDAKEEAVGEGVIREYEAK